VTPPTTDISEAPATVDSSREADCVLIPLSLVSSSEEEIAQNVQTALVTNSVMGPRDECEMAHMDTSHHPIGHGKYLPGYIAEHMKITPLDHNIQRGTRYDNNLCIFHCLSGSKIWSRTGSTITRSTEKQVYPRSSFRVKYHVP